MTQTMTLAEVAGTVADGAHVGIGGVLLERKPIAVIAALITAGLKDLVVSSFLASLDVEMLVAAGCARTVRTGYVGFEHRGGAPVLRRAIQEGTVVVQAHSELTYTRGLRAAAAGLPFLPLRGVVGTQLVEDLDLREVEDPYGSGPVLVAPATPLDIALIHCHEADERGVVAAPATATFLWDADLAVAAAADRVIVTAERLVERTSAAALLTALDVDVVVEVPRGAAPLGLTGCYEPNEGWIGGYLREPDPGGHLTEWMAEGMPL